VLAFLCKRESSHGQLERTRDPIDVRLRHSSLLERSHRPAQQALGDVFVVPSNHHRNVEVRTAQVRLAAFLAQ